MVSLAARRWFFPAFIAAAILTSTIMFVLPIWHGSSIPMRQLGAAGLGVTLCFILAIAYEILAACVRTRS